MRSIDTHRTPYYYKVMTKRMDLTLKEEDIESLRELATKLGYIVDRGSAKGIGSVRQMVQAIARGEITLTFSQSIKAKQ